MSFYSSTKNKLQKLDPEKSVANFCRKFILVPEKHLTGFVEAINAEQRRFSTKSVPHISDSPRSPPPVTISMEKTKLLFIYHFMSNIGVVIWRKKLNLFFIFILQLPHPCLMNQCLLLYLENRPTISWLPPSILGLTRPTQPARLWDTTHFWLAEKAIRDLFHQLANQITTGKKHFI